MSRPYSINYPMDGHKATLHTEGVFPRVSTTAECECGAWHSSTATSMHKARITLNRLYQDHLVRVAEGRYG